MGGMGGKGGGGNQRSRGGINHRLNNGPIGGGIQAPRGSANYSAFGSGNGNANGGGGMGGMNNRGGMGMGGGMPNPMGGMGGGGVPDQSTLFSMTNGGSKEGGGKQEGSRFGKGRGGRGPGSDARRQNNSFGGGGNDFQPNNRGNNNMNKGMNGGQKGGQQGGRVQFPDGRNNRRGGKIVQEKKMNAERNQTRYANLNGPDGGDDQDMGDEDEDDIGGDQDGDFDMGASASSSSRPTARRSGIQPIGKGGLVGAGGLRPLNQNSRSGIDHRNMYKMQPKTADDLVDEALGFGPGYMEK